MRLNTARKHKRKQKKNKLLGKMTRSLLLYSLDSFSSTALASTALDFLEFKAHLSTGTPKLPRVKARLRPRPAQGKSCPEPRKQLPMRPWRAAWQVLEPLEAGLRMYYRLAAGPLLKHLLRLFEGLAAALESLGLGAVRSLGLSLELALEARQALALRASCEVFASLGWAGKNFLRTSEVLKTRLGWLQRKKKAAWARSPSSFFRKEISSREVKFSQQGKNYSCICSRKQPVVAPKAKAKVRKRQDHRNRTADLRDFLHGF